MKNENDVTISAKVRYYFVRARAFEMSKIPSVKYGVLTYNIVKYDVGNQITTKPSADESSDN